MLNSSDSELWKAFKTGSLEAFQSIYKAHYGNLYNFAFKVTQSRAVSSDCLQNLFLRLWNSRERLADVQAIKPYLFTALRHDLKRISYLSLQQKNQAAELLNSHVTPTFSPEDLLIEGETRQGLREKIVQVLNTLPDRQKEAVYLKYYEELSYQDIAAIMGINYQSVVNLLFKAMSNLKKARNLQKLSVFLNSLLLISAMGYSFFM